MLDSKQDYPEPYLSYHEAKDIEAVVYGDDDTLLGDETSLDWLRLKLEEFMFVIPKLD